jgi:drug/metabolite transporter (DMT)-like permease
MRISQVFGLLTVGAGGSALATVLFTMSFRDIHPSVAILLQKLQPIFVLILASIFLKEKLHARFLKWAALALLAGFILSFPDLDFSFLRGETNSQNRGVFFAVGAALLWATSTVVGKKLLTGISPLQLTGWRYLFGFLTLVIYISQSQIAWSWGVLYEDRIALRSVLLMSLVSGLFAMFLYYQGLVRTRATTATLMELLFPVAAVLLNAWVLDRPLELMQVSAGLVLLIAVTRISFLRLPSVQE